MNGGNDGYKYALAIVFLISVKARTVMKQLYLAEQYFVQK